jgi:hypothetical protein
VAPNRQRRLQAHEVAAENLRRRVLEVGLPARGEEESGPQAIAEYSEVASLTVEDEFITSDTESGEPELLSASALLAASFGLVFNCAKNSYRGTIKHGRRARKSDQVNGLTSSGC